MAVISDSRDARQLVRNRRYGGVRKIAKINGENVTRSWRGICRRHRGDAE